MMPFPSTMLRLTQPMALSKLLCRLFGKSIDPSPFHSLRYPTLRRRYRRVIALYRGWTHCAILPGVRKNITYGPNKSASAEGCAHRCVDHHLLLQSIGVIAADPARDRKTLGPGRHRM